MNVSLTPELERFIQKRVGSGRYHSASEVVREALRLLEEQSRLRNLEYQRLRRDIAVGLQQADRGELVEGATVFQELRGRNRERAKRTR